MLQIALRPLQLHHVALVGQAFETSTPEAFHAALLLTFPSDDLDLLTTVDDHNMHFKLVQIQLPWLPLLCSTCNGKMDSVKGGVHNCLMFKHRTHIN